MKQITRIGSVYKPGEPIFWKRKGGAFSPLDLFASGEEGAWYDPSDFSTMFQDDLGTIPVTAVGQTVGKILDKSGRGNHATQATEANRPVLQQDGNGKYYLGFDGVDDSLATAAIDFTATDKISVFSGVYKTAPTSGTAIVAELSVAADSNNGTFALFTPRGIATNDLGFWSKGTVNSAAVSGNVYAADILYVETGIGDIAGDSAILRVNGSQSVSSVTDQGTGNYGNYALYVGSRNSTTLRFKGRIYSLIVRGALSTTQEIADTETWVAGKTGVTLP